MADDNKTPKHQWLLDGQSVDAIEKANGIAYNDNGESFVWTLPGATAGTPQTMLALFGARTLATNTVSAQYGPKANPADKVRPRKADAAETDVAALRDRFAAITTGDWGAERGGGGSIGYNLDDLCEALGQVVTAAGAPFNAEKVRATLETGGTYRGQALDAKAYRKAIYDVAGVKEAYQALRAAKRPAVAVEDVADEFA